MRENPENPEFPEDYDDFEAEAAPVAQEVVDAERDAADHAPDGYEQLRERRALGHEEADDADVAEQSRVVDLDEEEYR